MFSLLHNNLMKSREFLIRAMVWRIHRSSKMINLHKNGKSRAIRFKPMTKKLKNLWITIIARTAPVITSHNHLRYQSTNLKLAMDRFQS